MSPLFKSKFGPQRTQNYSIIKGQTSIFLLLATLFLTSALVFYTQRTFQKLHQITASEEATQHGNAINQYQVARTNEKDFFETTTSIKFDPVKSEEQKIIIEDFVQKQDDQILQISAINTNISKQRLEETMSTGYAYLHRVLDQDGRFWYIFNLNDKHPKNEKYNIVRHAGTIYAMASYEKEFGDGSHIQHLISAVRFLQEKALKPVLGNDMLAVWDYDTTDNEVEATEISLGGCGLGLVGLLATEKLLPGTTPLEDLQKLARFITFMQQKNGGFYSKYIPAEGGYDKKFHSLYYPGEAALGLVMMYELDKDERWLESSAKALGYLASTRLGQKHVEGDHWALIATAKLLPVYHEMKSPPVSYVRILEHAIQVCGSMIEEGRSSILDPQQYGCHTFDGRTTPTATRMEGLQQALTFIPQSHSNLRQRMQAVVNLGITFLINSQISQGEHKGVILRGTRHLQAGEGGFYGKDLNHFNKRVDEFRIDYVQHPLSAFMHYWHMHYQDA